MIVHMAGLTICYGFYLFDNLVLYLQMTLITFDFVGGNMRIMQEISIFVFIESVRFPVAFITVFSRDFSISDDGVAVTFIALKTICKHNRMIEPRSFF